MLAYVRAAGLQVHWHLETHGHADHLSAAPYLQRALGGRIVIGVHICGVQKVFKQIFNDQDMATGGSPFDHLFHDGDTFAIGNLQARVSPAEDNGTAYLKIPFNVLGLRGLGFTSAS